MSVKSVVLVVGCQLSILPTDNLRLMTDNWQRISATYQPRGRCVLAQPWYNAQIVEHQLLIRNVYHALTTPGILP
jgi:hypothetical protein